MSALNCFRKKIAAGVVSREIGHSIAAMVEQAERTYAKRLNAAEAAMQAAIEVAGEAERIAARKAQIAVGAAEAQLRVLKGWQAYQMDYGLLVEAGKQPAWDRGWTLWQTDPLRTPLSKAMRSFLVSDPSEIARWGNVHYEARNIRDQAHVLFRDAIGPMQPKALGFKAERALEFEVLDVLYDKAVQVSPQARAVAEAWAQTAEFLRQSFVMNRGALPERENWRLPNPGHSTIKVRSIAKEDWKAFTLQRLDREQMLDLETGARLSDDKLSGLLDEVYDRIVMDGAEAMPTAGRQGQRMLASRRAEARVLVFKDAAGWREYAEAFGSTSSVYEVMVSHIHAMADDIALLKVLGPNPEGTKQFMLSLFDREAARLAQQARLADPKAADAAVALNRKIEAQVRAGRRSFENLWAQVTNANDVPVNIELAHLMGEARGTLVAAQMGSAIVSSITDPALMLMTARFNGIPAFPVLQRAVAGMTDKGFELNAAQLGLAADGIAHALHQTDRFMGDTIRTGLMAQVGTAVIRASGLRRWTGVLRAAFGMEFMAYGANQMGKPFDALAPEFRGALDRYGIDAAGWDAMRAATPSEPRRDGRFLTANDIRAVGTPEALRAADNWQRAIDTEMDYAVIEGDPAVASMVKGQSQPGTAEGELRRAVGMYKSFPTTVMVKHFGRAFARGFDGERLSHAALTLAAMTMMGMVAFQAKQVLAGRDPVSMDPTDMKGVRAWGAAMLQGGGLGIFGDFFFQDQTRQSTSFAATLAGPMFGAAEKLIGDFAIANVQRAWKGQETHFAGDALYALAPLVPGSSLWYWRTAYQRAVVDQLALMIDDRTPERFARIEREAQKLWGQSFWLEPGSVQPRRAPSLSAAMGGP